MNVGSPAQDFLQHFFFGLVSVMIENHGARFSRIESALNGMAIDVDNLGSAFCRKLMGIVKFVDLFAFCKYFDVIIGFFGSSRESFDDGFLFVGLQTTGTKHEPVDSNSCDRVVGKKRHQEVLKTFCTVSKTKKFVDIEKSNPILPSAMLCNAMIVCV